MTFSDEQVEALKAKLDPAHVADRQQAGRKLSYIEGWWAISEANRIFGFDSWHRETVDLQETSRDLVKVPGYNGKPDYDQWRVSFLARVRITVGDIVREGTGYGSGMAKPEALGDAIESAAKEAETDAMKRALMTFGNPFGLALYDKTQANVGVEQPATKSSAALKRAGSWEAIMSQFNEDAVDCTTLRHLELMKDTYRLKAKAEGFTPAWNAALADEFMKLEEQIVREMEREDA